VLRNLKRIIGLSPRLEWRCGTSWNIDLFKALANGTDSEIAKYKLGRVVWERDCAAELREFKYRCLEYLLNNAPDSNASFSFPPSFADALKAKRDWFNGAADKAVLMQVVETVMQDTENWWPSNWCFGINSMFCAKSVVTAALEENSLGPSTSQCAENLILYMGFTSACTTINCSETVQGEQTEELDNGLVVRAVDCPHMEDDNLHEIAKKSIDATASKWRQQLVEELTGMITPSPK